jgi:hypothetical protein
LAVFRNAGSFPISRGNRLLTIYRAFADSDGQSTPSSQWNCQLAESESGLAGMGRLMKGIVSPALEKIGHLANRFTCLLAAAA